MSEGQMTPREIADGWVLSYLVSSSMTHPERERAQDRMIDLAAEQPIAALEAISLVLDHTADEWVLTNLGAGPIESLLHSAPRPTLKLLATHPRANAVAIAIANVWAGSLEKAVAEELARLSADLAKSS
jgi:hypothetical protein